MDRTSTAATSPDPVDAKVMHEAIRAVQKKLKETTPVLDKIRVREAARFKEALKMPEGERSELPLQNLYGVPVIEMKHMPHGVAVMVDQYGKILGIFRFEHEGS